MAEDSTPNIGLIVRVGGILIIAVVVIRLVLTSYFSHMEDNEHEVKYVEMGQPARNANAAAKAAEMTALASGPMPIDKAMQLIATQNRAVPGVEPHPADPMREKDTLAGWAQMPREVPSALLLMTAPPAASAAGDAGAPAASASGMPMTAPSGSAAPAPSGSAAVAPSASAPRGASSAPAPSTSNH